MAKTIKQPSEAYAVLLYPPVGKPRVVAVPPPPPGFEKRLQVFKTKAKADAALEAFLTANPEYRTWRDGSLSSSSPASDQKGGV